MTRPEDFSAYDAADPGTQPAELARMAELRPDLRVLVAANPSTPPEALARLGALGDVAVDAALRRRSGLTETFPVSPTTRLPVTPPPPGGSPAGARDPYAPGSPYPADRDPAAPDVRDPYAAPPGAPGGAGTYPGGPGAYPGGPGTYPGGPGTYPGDGYPAGTHPGGAYPAGEGSYPGGPVGPYPGGPYPGSPGYDGAGYGGSQAPWETATLERAGRGVVRWIVVGAVAVIAVVVLVAVMLGRAADPDPGPTGPVATDAPASGSPDAFAYGDDPYFDALWDSCESGDAQACDDLFQESPVDSEYEEFGASCGGRFPGTEEWCVDVMG